MKTLTVRLSEALVAEIEAESRTRRMSRSDVVRGRLQQQPSSVAGSGTATLDLIRDLAGSVDGLPTDLSSRTDGYLKAGGYGKNRSGRHRVSRRATQST